MIAIALIQIITLSSLIFFQKKLSFLIDSKKDVTHKIAFKASIPLTGAIYFLISSIIFHSFFYPVYFFLLSALFFFIYSIYFDDNNNFSPKFRFIIQIFFLIFVLIYFDIRINKFNLELLDILKSKNIFIDYLLTFLCIIVLINGSNFIDGKNGLCIGFYLLVNFFTLLILDLNLNDDNYYNIVFRFLTITCFIFYCFNILGKTIMGDGGVYAISILTAYNLIDLSNNIDFINPFLVFSLLIFPCLEVLNSIIRRVVSKKNPTTADSSHLHHKIYSYLKSKKKIDFIANSLTGIIYNLYILIFFTIYFFYYDSPTKLILFCCLKIFLYIIINLFFKSLFRCN